jgi:hypothetical protein
VTERRAGLLSRPRSQQIGKLALQIDVYGSDLIEGGPASGVDPELIADSTAAGSVAGRNLQRRSPPVDPLQKIRPKSDAPSIAPCSAWSARSPELGAHEQFPQEPGHPQLRRGRALDQRLAGS